MTTCCDIPSTDVKNSTFCTPCGDFSCGNKTNLVPRPFFSNNNGCGGCGFTNSLYGPPSSDKTIGQNFQPISGFSNILMTGLPPCSRVILQNCNCNAPLLCPVLPAPPLGRMANPCCFNEYCVNGPCFKFGPVHLGFDSWRDAIPKNMCKSDCVTVGKHNNNKAVVCCTPINIQVLIIPNGSRGNCCAPICINIEIYIQSCEGQADAKILYNCG
jgi:hypothetical protein